MSGKMKVNLCIDQSTFAAYQDCVKAKEQIIDELALENGKLKEAIHKFANCYYGEGGDSLAAEDEMDNLLALATHGVEAA
jgi:hypothetical protein